MIIASVPQPTDLPHSPLREPEGALVLDTTRLAFEEQVEAILTRVAQVDRRGGSV